MIPGDELERLSQGLSPLPQKSYRVEIRCSDGVGGIGMSLKMFSLNRFDKFAKKPENSV